MRKITGWLRLALLLTGLSWIAPAVAQQMTIDNFGQLKKGLLGRKTFETDKTQATLDLYTSEKGFAFEVPGGKDISATEDDDHVTLLLPNRTQSITIKHPEYGELQWKVPEQTKRLKKKHRYRADLTTLSAKKEYHVGKQWAVFYVEPENAILYIDSTQLFVHDGKAQAYLPLGEHPCRIEAPFHEEWTGIIHLNDTVRTEQHVTLQSLYSYLTVRTPLTGCSILLNGSLIGHTQALSSRISAGRYRLTVVKDKTCYYNEWIDIQPTEKKVVDLQRSQLKAQPLPPTMTMEELAALPVTNGEVEVKEIKAPVHIVAADGKTDILINRDVVGQGEWRGTLSQGLYAINAVKDGLESATSYLRIDNDLEQTVTLAAPQSAYGMLNVESNVVDAEIFINGTAAGVTPAVIRNLAADRNYEVRLAKAGYKDIVKSVYIRGNEMNHLTINMKTN